MDIDGLRTELEKHLKNNPHPDAPDGFRDRFEQFVEMHAAETDATDKSELETQLVRIRDEAAAACKAGDSGGRDSDAGGDSPTDQPAGLDEPRAEVPRPGLPRPGLALTRGRLGIILGAVAAAAAAAFYFYSGS